ncbi:MAG: hypothetical protein KAH12_08710 [Anaerolineales bacterium]|nr:hypothetical protein [Anaerolineales bacterium]
MTKFFKGITLISIALFLTTACENTDDKSLLTDGIWNFSNMTTDSESEATQALILLGKALLTEGTMEFKDDKSYILSSPLLQDPQTGTWSLIVDQLILDSDGDLVSTSNIETLSKTELIYTETLVDAELQSHKVTTSWSK